VCTVGGAARRGGEPARSPARQQPVRGYGAAPAGENTCLRRSCMPAVPTAKTTRPICNHCLPTFPTGGRVSGTGTRVPDRGGIGGAEVAGHAAACLCRPPCGAAGRSEHPGRPRRLDAFGRGRRTLPRHRRHKPSRRGAPPKWPRVAKRRRLQSCEYSCGAASVLITIRSAPARRVPPMIPKPWWELIFEFLASRVSASPMPRSCPTFPQAIPTRRRP
jgi:hypothetical protein